MTMSNNCRLAVHLLPDCVDPDFFRNGLVVVIDILRATTSMIYALAAGAEWICPVGTVEEAFCEAKRQAAKKCLIAGERGGVVVDGFDLGNSPQEFEASVCAGRPIVWTTTNGTKAILRAAKAKRVLIGSFVNFSAVCEEIEEFDGPVHLLCSGTGGEASLEDVLFAGAVVDLFAECCCHAINDAARIAWDAFENHGSVLVSALELSKNGRHLLDLGFDGDLKDAAEVDRFGIVPEVTFDPTRIVTAGLRLDARRFRGQTGLV